LALKTHLKTRELLKNAIFKEEKLVNAYRSITPSQFLYASSLLVSASNIAKEEMVKQQIRFFNII